MISFEGLFEFLFFIEEVNFMSIKKIEPSKETLQLADGHRILTPSR